MDERERLPATAAPAATVPTAAAALTIAAGPSATATAATIAIAALAAAAATVSLTVPPTTTTTGGREVAPEQVRSGPLLLVIGWWCRRLQTLPYDGRTATPSCHRRQPQLVLAPSPACPAGEGMKGATLHCYRPASSGQVCS